MTKPEIPSACCEIHVGLMYFYVPTQNPALNCNHYNLVLTLEQTMYEE